jgi:hypothetical protein
VLGLYRDWWDHYQRAVWLRVERTISNDRCDPIEKRGNPMSVVTVEIDSRLVRFVRSPVFAVVAALQGVCVSFAPVFLYWSGQGKFYHGYEWFVVPSCFAVICLVPVVYFRLGGAVVKELRKKQDRDPAGVAQR